MTLIVTTPSNFIAETSQAQKNQERLEEGLLLKFTQCEQRKKLHP